MVNRRLLLLISLKNQRSNYFHLVLFTANFKNSLIIIIRGQFLTRRNRTDKSLQGRALDEAGFSNHDVIILVS